MIGILALPLGLAILNWIAIAKQKTTYDYVLKPATSIAILGWAWMLSNDTSANPYHAHFFLWGLFFSVVGDILLMLPNARSKSTSLGFLAGLIAFLFAHLCYVTGLNPTLPPPVAIITFIPMIIFGVTFYRRVATNLRHTGRTVLLLPVGVYSIIIGLTVCSAWATLFRPECTSLRCLSVILGATLFCTSDVILAWGRFFSPAIPTRLYARITYHLGQMALAASIEL